MDQFYLLYTSYYKNIESSFQLILDPENEHTNSHNLVSLFRFKQIQHVARKDGQTEPIS